LDKPDDERRLCSLYLSLLERMEVPAKSFGDATAALAGF
jgi:hypothetical protein